jgi:hypothetical protein
MRMSGEPILTRIDYQNANLPLAIKIGDSEVNIQRLLPHRGQRVDEGMITMEHVAILLYRDNNRDRRARFSGAGVTRGRDAACLWHGRLARGREYSATQEQSNLYFASVDLAGIPAKPAEYSRSWASRPCHSLPRPDFRARPSGCPRLILLTPPSWPILCESGFGHNARGFLVLLQEPPCPIAISASARWRR